jgi:hypothetical protein
MNILYPLMLAVVMLFCWFMSIKDDMIKAVKEIWNGDKE